MSSIILRCAGSVYKDNMILAKNAGQELKFPLCNSASIAETICLLGTGRVWSLMRRVQAFSSLW
jgi:hypothetical protein